MNTVLLSESGTWQIVTELLLHPPGRYVSFPPTVHLHKEERYGFFEVYTSIFLETEKRSIRAEIIAVAMLFVVLVSTYYNRRVVKLQEEQGRKLESMFKSISKRIKKLHDLIRDEIDKKRLE